MHEADLSYELPSPLEVSAQCSLYIEHIISLFNKDTKDKDDWKYSKASKKQQKRNQEA